MTTTVNPFSSMNDETFAAAMVPAMADVDALRLWAAESERRRAEMAEKVKASEQAKTANRPTGKPGFTPQGVPCILWPGYKTETRPNPPDRCQVERRTIVLTLPGFKEDTTEKTVNGKKTTTVKRAEFAPMTFFYLPQDCTIGPKGGCNISPDNLWMSAGSADTHNPEKSDAIKSLMLVTDDTDCWVQETNASVDGKTPATARQIPASEFIPFARKMILDWFAAHKVNRSR